VDEEANIILGATFDAALDGVVRVSVVATGIDQAAIGRIEPVSQAARAEIPWRSRPAPPRAAPSAIAEESVFETEKALPEAIARVDEDEVEVRPAAYAEPVAPHREEPIDAEFTPPAPEQPKIRPPRMPQIEELPPLAQDQLRARRGETSPSAHPAETRRLSLLEKLAAFGISRRENEEAPAPDPRAIAPALPAAPPKSSANALHAEYGRPQPRPAAPRPAQGNLDAHGRVAAPAAPMEDDQLEIPAFLRRHSS
jgi:cell division protein FtsZ